MCGIVGAVGKAEVSPLLLEGLNRLAYRGYDSAGIATITQNGIDRRRAEGKLQNLVAKMANDPLPGTIGIGHTRWATHGGPTENNAHPHASDKVAVVHNGIIENYQELRDELSKHQVRFESETDTEVIVQLITHYINHGMTPIEASRKTLARLHGAFSLGIIFAGDENLICAARRGTPLAIGHGKDAMYIASDALALAPLTNQICYLSDGDFALLTAHKIEIYDDSGARVERPVRTSSLSADMIGKGEYRHFMLKEIHEQPEVLGDTINALMHPASGEVYLPEMTIDFAKINRLTITACGTAYYAGMVAKYWFEQIAKLPVELDIASEWRYRDVPVETSNAMLVISQSGETLDTLEALRLAKKNGYPSFAIINVPESTMAREADATVFTKAGPEIGVASTKAFTTQLATLAALTLHAAKLRGTITADNLRALTAHLREIPALMAEALRLEKEIKLIATDIHTARDVLYLGRGTMFPMAMEGALKLKEISYIHAEGYAAGEMKHGPIALIDEDVPVILLAPPDALLDKTLANMQEVAARGGKVLLISDSKGCTRGKRNAAWAIEMPACDPFIAPLLYALPIQLLAYHIAVLKGTDVDQPRNLAKAVTVE
ncbi:MAG TPA: glutamine--fructose-6-phosphate transaminase (isomerizing) [Alphaproteobacteria bacterium]|nr:glutamine--fructose-6-phosphate transaminase (isomerizing) [Rhodospirillaceae bacterium]HRJ12229.1 glutamine--fructose-6-phosphate transaminase (isomerizing) [Alphaproteobacteria bacterium]